MTGQELWASLLQEAIQGRLVEQRDDEPAVEQIGEAPEDVPFAIPEKWKWVRLGDVGSWKAGATPPRSNGAYYSNGTIPWLKTGDLNDGIVTEVPENITQKALDETSVRLNPKGSVLMAMYGATIGKIGLLGIDCTTNQACCACIVNSDIYNWWLFYYLLSQRSNFIALGAGGAQPNISKEKIVSFPIPLPPLAEQRRIVARLEELRPLVDDYGTAEAELTRMEAELPDKLRASLLQEAIQGRLVEQRDDEPAVEQVGDAPEDVPFAIPEKWKWVTLGDVVIKLTDGEHKTPKYTHEGIPFISVKNISSGKLIFCNTKFISNDDYLSFKKRCNPEIDDILLSKVGTTGIPAIVDTDKKFSLFVSVALLKLKKDVMFHKFMYHVLFSPLVQQQAQENTRGVGNKNWVLKAIAATQIPLPPLAEQRRIVARLEELLPEVARLAG